MVEIKDCSFQCFLADGTSHSSLLHCGSSSSFPTKFLLLLLGIFSTIMSKRNQIVYLTHEIPETLLVVGISVPGASQARLLNNSKKVTTKGDMSYPSKLLY